MIIPLLAGLLALQQPSSYPEHGHWGTRTVALDRAYSSPQGVAVASPDRRSIAVALGDEDKDTFQIKLSGALGQGSVRVASGPNQELMWSPDSQALFVTADDGGVVGTYELTVIWRRGGKVASRDISGWLGRQFGRPVRCFEPETWNVAGVTWIGGSHRLLAAVQIPNHSNCDDMGGFAAFEIDPIRMRLLAMFNQIEAKRRFHGALGEALMAADDRCVSTPSICWIPQLHRGGHPRRRPHRTKPPSSARTRRSADRTWPSSGRRRRRGSDGPRPGGPGASRRRA